MNFSTTARYLWLCANASGGQITRDVWLVEDRASGIVTATFSLLFLVVGLPWNLLVIVTIVKQRLYTQPTIILLLSLVITDLILLVLVIPVLIVTGFTGEYILGSSDSIRCTTCITGSMSHATSLMSVFTISLMSCDRFLFIYKPLKYQRYVTSRRTVAVITVTCLFVALASVPPLFGFGDIVFYPPLFSCIFDMTVQFGYYPVLIFIVSFIPVPPLLLSNMGVIYIVQKNIRAIYGYKKSDSNAGSDVGDMSFYKTMKKKRQQKQLHMIEVFGCLLCSNMITWVPIVIVCFLSILPVESLVIPSGLTAAAQILFMSQVLLHPLVETMMIPDVRVPLKKLILCRVSRAKARELDDAATHTSSLGCCFHYHGNDEESPNGEASSPDGCDCFGYYDSGTPPSGCRGFLMVCGAAMLMQYPLRRTLRTTSTSSRAPLKKDSATELKS
jgi:hypothetical protein